MTARLALVVSTTTDERAALVAARLRYLLEAGWDARLFCKGQAWQHEPALRDPGVRKRVELSPNARADSSPFDRRLRKLRPDLVHFHSGWVAWKGTGSGQLPESRVVISFREDGQDLAVPDLEFLWQRGRLFVFRHEAALERAVARGCPRSRAAVLHAPVDRTEGTTPRKSQHDSLRILSAGSLVWEQGFEHSVHAVRLLIDMGVPCDYRIIGEGDHVQAVAFARHQLGLADQVHLLAPDGSDGLAEELRSADVFVDPAVTDTTSPTALLSAMAQGVPFVATARRAGLPESAGITVPRRNPQAIAEALARLAADAALRERMGRQGLRSVVLPGLQSYMTELESLYRSALDQGF